MVTGACQWVVGLFYYTCDVVSYSSFLCTFVVVLFLLSVKFCVCFYSCDINTKCLLLNSLGRIALFVNYRYGQKVFQHIPAPKLGEETYGSNTLQHYSAHFIADIFFIFMITNLLLSHLHICASHIFFFILSDCLSFPLYLLYFLSLHPLSTEPPVLNKIPLFTRQRDEVFRVDFSAGNTPAFPFPIFTWSRAGGEAVVNMTGRVYGYPSVSIDSVQPSDIGYYNLTAMNYLHDGTTPTGFAFVSFYLDILCE